MTKGTKIVFFLIVGLGLSLAANAAVSSYRLKKKEEEALSENQKFINSMREKYKEINNFDEFHEGVKYVEYPTPFGYDLRVLKQIENLSELITLDELKIIYETAKNGLAKNNEEENTNFIKLMNKIFDNK